MTFSFCIAIEQTKTWPASYSTELKLNLSPKDDHTRPNTKSCWVSVKVYPHTRPSSPPVFDHLHIHYEGEGLEDVVIIMWLQVYTVLGRCLTIIITQAFYFGQSLVAWTMNINYWCCLWGYLASSPWTDITKNALRSSIDISPECLDFASHPSYLHTHSNRWRNLRMRLPMYFLMQLMYMIKFEMFSWLTCVPPKKLILSMNYCTKARTGVKLLVWCWQYTCKNAKRYCALYTTPA